MNVTYEIRFKALEAPDAITLINIQGEGGVRPTLEALHKAGAVIVSVERVTRTRLDPGTMLLTDEDGAIVRDNGSDGSFRSVLKTYLEDGLRINIFMNYSTPERAAQVASRHANLHRQQGRESNFHVEKWVHDEWEIVDTHPRDHPQHREAP